jgi:hypothetical protein
MNTLEARRIENSMRVQPLEQLTASFTGAKQANIRETQRQEAIQRGKIAAEIVRHYHRGRLGIGSEIIRQFG